MLDPDGSKNLIEAWCHLLKKKGSCLSSWAKGHVAWINWSYDILVEGQWHRILCYSTLRQNQVGTSDIISLQSTPQREEPVQWINNVTGQYMSKAPIIEGYTRRKRMEGWKKKQCFYQTFLKHCYNIFLSLIPEILFDHTLEKMNECS